MKVDNRGGPKAVRDWHRHHTDKTWRQFTTSWYSYGGGRPDGPPTCEADEWPPNYFLDSDQLKQGTKNKDGQLVRWLPQNPNGDAGLQWRLWCQENDGDAGNGLREKPAGAEELKSGNEVYVTSCEWRILCVVTDCSNSDLKTKPFNRQLVDLKGDPTVKSSTSMGVTTTTSIWSSAEFSRGVFSFTFDFATTPSADNNWLLEENPW